MIGEKSRLHSLPRRGAFLAFASPFARLVRKGTNFESLLCGLSPPVLPRPIVVSPIYPLRRQSLRQPHPAHQVGVARVGAQGVEQEISLQTF